MANNFVLSSLGFGNAKYKAMQDFNYATPQSLWLGVPYLGQCFSVWGNVYQVVQNRSGGALAVGDAVSLSFADAARTGNLATGATGAVLLTDDTLDSGLAGAEVAPSYVCVTAGALATTADMQRRFILGNSTAAGASTIIVAKATPSDGSINGTDILSAEIITGTVDNTYDYDVFCPGEVVKADADALATQMVQGIVVSTSITDDYFGIIQIAGVAIAKVDGTTDLAAGDRLITDSAAGVLSKFVFTNTAATTIQGEQGTNTVGRILNAYTNNGVGLRHIQLLNRPLVIYPIV